MKKQLLSIALMAILPAAAQAELSIIPYGGLGIERQTIKIGGAKFESNLALAHIGTWISPGIGLEVEYGQGLGDDTQNGVTLEQPSLLVYGLRLSTPPSEANGVLYLLMGGAQSTLNMSDYPGEDSFKGYHLGIGFGSQVGSRLMADLSYHDYNVDESFKMYGFRLNLEYSLGGEAQ